MCTGPRESRPAVGPLHPLTAQEARAVADAVLDGRIDPLPTTYGRATVRIGDRVFEDVEIRAWEYPAGELAALDEGEWLVPGWDNVPRGPVEYRYAGPDEGDPYEIPEGSVGHFAHAPAEGLIRAGLWDAALAPSPGPQEDAEGPAAAHLSSRAAREAYAAAGRLRDAGEARDDDLAEPEPLWPFKEWPWGPPATASGYSLPVDVVTPPTPQPLRMPSPPPDELSRAWQEWRASARLRPSLDSPIIVTGLA